jgi:hypothetical protein
MDWVGRRQALGAIGGLLAPALGAIASVLGGSEGGRTQTVAIAQAAVLASALSLIEAIALFANLR